jgi:short-subunit dehydrogenase
MSTTQKYALITGATSGIGHEFAKLFAQDGYNLVLVARNTEALENISRDFKSKHQIEVLTIAKDLFKRESPFEIYDELQSKSIHIDVLVNDAGQGQYGEFAETDINREIDIIQLNIIAYVVLTKLFLKEMLAKGEGKILNVSSIGGELPGPLQSVYHATKAFVTSFTEAIRSENKDRNITITALLPGITDTDFFRKAEQEDAKMVKEGSPADPAKVAKDGYEALMSGDDKIVSGLKNKAMVASSQIMPDHTVADMMHKAMEPSDKEDDKS